MCICTYVQLNLCLRTLRVKNTIHIFDLSFMEISFKVSTELFLLPCIKISVEYLLTLME